MFEWKPYLNDRLIQKREGFFIIKPINSRVSIPLSCPVCHYLMRNSDDEKSYHEFECCESCETFWARPNLAKWKDGWRPDKEQIEQKFQGRKKITANISF